MSDSEDFVEAAAKDAMMQLAIELGRSPDTVAIAMVTSGLKSLVGVVGVEQTQAIIRSLADNLPQIVGERQLN